MKTPLCVAKEWPHENGEGGDTAELLRSDNAPLPLGFLTDKLVACAVMTQLTWWGTDGTQQPMTAGSFPVAHLPFAMTDRGLIAGHGPNLAIATPETNQFLGYGVHELTALRITPGAVVVTGSDQAAVLLDDGLRERARFELGRSRTSWNDFVPLDERYGVASVQRRSFDHRTASFQLAVFDGLALATHQQLPFEVREGAIAYEPSTGLLATRDAAMAMLLRYDRLRHTFGEPVRVGSAIAAGKLVVIDPQLSNGVVALEISEVPDGQMIGELRDEDLAAGRAIDAVQPRTTYRVPGELRAVDRAGHLYIRPVKDHDDLMIYTRDLPVARLAGIAGMTIRPSPDGARIAAFHSPRLLLLTAAGEVRWDSAQWSGADVDWTSTGELVVQFPTGVARIDLDTGELADRRCGWSFGLSDQPLDARHSGPSICD